MNPEAIAPIGLVLLVHLLYTLAVSAVVGLMIWYAGLRERSLPARRGEEA